MPAPSCSLMASEEKTSAEGFCGQGISRSEVQYQGPRWPLAGEEESLVKASPSCPFQEHPMSIPKVLLTGKETPTRGCAVLAGVVTCSQAGRGEQAPWREGGARQVCSEGGLEVQQRGEDLKSSQRMSLPESQCTREGARGTGLAREGRRGKVCFWLQAMYAGNPPKDGTH